MSKEMSTIRKGQELLAMCSGHEFPNRDGG